MDDATIEAIAHRLATPIPKPYRLPPTPQASWRTLKPGQHLRNRADVTTPATGHVAAGTGLWEVRACDSGGVWLQLTSPAKAATLRDQTELTFNATLKWSQIGSKPLLRWARPDWKIEWERVRKPAKRKAKL